VISAPLIAGVGKDAGTASDLSLAGFLGADEVDFKSVVAGFFAVESEKIPSDVPVTGKADAGHKGSTPEVKVTDKAEKAKPELQAVAQVNVLAPVAIAVPPAQAASPEPVKSDQVPTQPEVVVADAPFNSQAPRQANIFNSKLTRHPMQDRNLSEPDEAVSVLVNKPVSVAQGNASSDAVTAGVTPPVAEPIQTAVAVEDNAPPARVDQEPDLGIESFHKVNSQIWRADASSEEIPPRQPDLVAPIAYPVKQGTAPASANQEEPVAAFLADGRPSAKVSDKAVVPQGAQVEVAGIAIAPQRSTGEPVPTVAFAKPPKREPHLVAQVITSKPAEPRTQVETDANHPTRVAGMPAVAESSAVTATPVQRAANSETRVSPQPVADAAAPAIHVLAHAVKVAPASQLGNMPTVTDTKVQIVAPQGGESAVVPVVVAKPALADKAPTVKDVPDAAAPVEVPATAAEPHKSPVPAARAEASVKSKARLGKEIAIAAPVSANSQPKHVDAAGTVLSTGIHKEGTGQGSTPPQCRHSTTEPMMRPQCRTHW